MLSVPDPLERPTPTPFNKQKVYPDPPQADDQLEHGEGHPVGTKSKTP